MHVLFDILHTKSVAYKQMR